MTEEEKKAYHKRKYAEMKNDPIKWKRYQEKQNRWRAKDYAAIMESPTRLKELRDKQSFYRKKYKEDAGYFYSFKQDLSAAKTRAKHRNLPFDLTLDWIVKEYEKGRCAVTGAPFSDVDEHPNLPSIDRIDSKLGYVQSNCRLVTRIYNFAKNIWSDKEVFEMSAALLTNSGLTLS